MKIIKFISIILILAIFSSSPAFAEKKGEITSAPCPYSCKSKGLSKSKCKDWREGNTCFVEDLTRQPSSNTRKNGFVTYRECPHSCNSAGISKSRCRDWKQNGMCYVEDLTREPSASPVYIGNRPSNTPVPIPPQDNTQVDPSWGNSDYQKCKEMNMRHMPRPYVNINRIKKSGNPLKDKYTVWGSIEGVCIVEAGYYEYGELKRNVSFRTSPGFGRYEFKFLIRKGKNPQIRVYNMRGDRNVHDIFDDRYDNRPYNNSTIYNYQNNWQGRPPGGTYYGRSGQNTEETPK